MRSCAYACVRRFTVRVLVPCYAEPLSVVSATVTAAMEADLPPGGSDWPACLLACTACNQRGATFNWETTFAASFLTPPGQLSSSPSPTWLASADAEHGAQNSIITNRWMNKRSMRLMSSKRGHWHLRTTQDCFWMNPHRFFDTRAHPASLPLGVRRELYLCDDGKDQSKRAWLETSYGESTAAKGRVHYVSGRCVHPELSATPGPKRAASLATRLCLGHMHSTSRWRTSCRQPSEFFSIRFSKLSQVP